LNHYSSTTCYLHQTIIHTNHNLLIHYTEKQIYTLFPYTTLFRSNIEVQKKMAASYVNGALEDRYERVVPADKQDKFTLETLIKKDRKSTRLNSSHRTISYAVFCLKKKYIYITLVAN